MSKSARQRPIGKSRNTPVRNALIGLFKGTKEPLTVREIARRMADTGLNPNKTTLYRELAFLIGEGVILDVDFGDRKKRYELASAAHHHHVVCTRCGRIADIAFPDDLATHERIARRQSGFRIMSHSLEFFGLCRGCV